MARVKCFPGFLRTPTLETGMSTTQIAGSRGDLRILIATDEAPTLAARCCSTSPQASRTAELCEQRATLTHPKAPCRQRAA